MSKKETVMFRFVPTMRCNFRCEYCFIDHRIKENGGTMFDTHSVFEWVEGMKRFSDYNIELYFWGGEPFCIEGTYELLKEWTKLDNIISGFRIDTNTYYADEIASRCPCNKIKLNCSYHMPYHSMEEEFRKVKLLKELDMIGMVNFVASEYNLTHLRDDYHMNVRDLIEKFAEIDVFLNIAGDFAFANNPRYERFEEYQAFIMQFISPEEWGWLRNAHKESRPCTAGMNMFTVEADGSFTSCMDTQRRDRGNFFTGKLLRDADVEICSQPCVSIVSYSFRCDNEFPSVNSLLGYVKRNQKYRNSIQDYYDFEF